jgi:hypothetical protein
MKCYVCGGDMKYLGDHELDEPDVPFELFSNFLCSDCGAWQLVFHPNVEGDN